MPTLTCARCGETRDPLTQPPVGGELGARIQGSICSVCWAEWSEASARLINHYGLVLGNADHRERIRSSMKQFLGFEPASAHEHQPDPGPVPS